jgi:hypothetical protein
VEPVDHLTAAVATTIAAHPDQVARWQSAVPGAWGFLAGRGVLAYRDRLGRTLTEPERRQLWETLWAALEKRRASSG